MKESRKELDYMPFDKSFNNELCHATGYEVCFNNHNPNDIANWWNEYEDSEGNLYYGR
jgi:hypothetical protein